MKKTSKGKGMRAVRGGGNVFADLNLPDADELMAKAQLIVVLASAIKSEHLTQTKAAERLGLTQPKVSRLLRGESEGFTLDKIMYLLRRMRMNVDIRITSASAKAATGCVTVKQLAMSRQAKLRTTPPGLARRERH